MYAYCGNNPINATDPDGLDPRTGAKVGVFFLPGKNDGIDGLVWVKSANARAGVGYYSASSKGVAVGVVRAVDGLLINSDIPGPFLELTGVTDDHFTFSPFSDHFSTFHIPADEIFNQRGKTRRSYYNEIQVNVKFSLEVVTPKGFAPLVDEHTQGPVHKTYRLQINPDGSFNPRNQRKIE